MIFAAIADDCSGETDLAARLEREGASRLPASVDGAAPRRVGQIKKRLANF